MEGFDVDYYLATYDDVRRNGIHPLIHFLRHGEGEGRWPRSSKGKAAAKPCAPLEIDWERLVSRIAAPSGKESRADVTVDVVIPVYRGYADTLACLYSVLTSANETPFELFVIEDFSPEPALTKRLRELAEEFEVRE